MNYNTDFFSIVNAQPSTAISCVADRNIIEKKIITSAVIFGFSFSGKNVSMFRPA
jgi:hypothetical protein